MWAHKEIETTRHCASCKFGWWVKLSVYISHFIAYTCFYWYSWCTDAFGNHKSKATILLQWKYNVCIPICSICPQLRCPQWVESVNSFRCHWLLYYRPFDIVFRRFSKGIHSHSRFVCSPLHFARFSENETIGAKQTCCDCSQIRPNQMPKA